MNVTQKLAGFAAATIACWMAVSPAAAAPQQSPPAMFKEPWIDGMLAQEPQTQVQMLDADTFVIRQSVKTNFEAPFLYLLFGNDKALLIDSGAGDAPIRQTVDGVVTRWLSAHGRTSIPLVVAHSHSHGDHIAGDAAFKVRADTQVIGLKPADVAGFFGIKDWPAQIGKYDLGGRALSIIPTPGHQSAHIMVYDPRLKIVFSGDALYPGRLYVPVNHLAEERASMDRLATFVRDHPVRALLGAHIEMSSTPGRDYAQAAPIHPDEHRLELPVSAVRELQIGLREPLDVPKQPQVHPDFIIYPVPPRAE